MTKLSVYFTEEFTRGPTGLSKLGPKRKADTELAFQRIYRRLVQIGRLCQNGHWLGLSHLQEAEHSRAAYPPQQFGAFLGDLDNRETGDCLAFSGLAGLSDKDAEGYFTRYDADLANLHCAVLYTALPSPRLVVFGIGGKAEMSRLLGALRAVDAAREAIAGARALA